MTRREALAMLALLFAPLPAEARSRRKKSTKRAAPKPAAPPAPPPEPSIDWPAAKIVSSGAAELDAPFAAAQALIDTIEVPRGQLLAAREALFVATGIAVTEPTSAAMTALKQRAGAALTVGFGDKLPAIDAGEAPAEVQPGIAALSRLLAGSVAAKDLSEGVGDAALRILAATGPLPERAAARAAEDPHAAALALAAVNNNVGALRALPERADLLARAATRFLDDARAVFAAKEK